jgi:hypothetical protein
MGDGIRKLRRLCTEDLTEFERKLGTPQTEEGARWRKNLLKAFESGWLQAVATVKKKRTGGRELLVAQQKQAEALAVCAQCAHVVAQHDVEWLDGRPAFVVCYQCDEATGVCNHRLLGAI